MLKVEATLIEEVIKRGLKRIEVDQQLQPMRVLPREDFKYSSILGVETKLEDSVESEAPIYVGEQLLEEAMAEPADKVIDRKALAVIAWDERHKASYMSKVPPLFYRQLRMLMSSEGINEKARRLMEASAVDVCDTRLRKILTYSLVPSLPQEVLNNMTTEESFLLELFRIMLSVWKKEVIGIGG